MRWNHLITWSLVLINRDEVIKKDSTTNKSMQEYFIGWHQPNNGKSGCGLFERCMISVNTLLRRKSHFKVRRWILDSGAFTRILSGKGHLLIEIYARLIIKWSYCGDLCAAVTQDYMCEKFILEITGMTIEEHQELTTQNYVKLAQLVSEIQYEIAVSVLLSIPFLYSLELINQILSLVKQTYIMPVIQGYSPRDYVNHIRMYGDLLSEGMWVGVGSVCKRNASPGQVESVLLAIYNERPDLKLHGFGIKRNSLISPVCWDLLYSADSQAHGFAGKNKKQKYNNSNDPFHALEYANSIKPPSQLSIFSHSY